MPKTFYNERKLCSEFSKWLRGNPKNFPIDNMAIEFKICKKKSLNFMTDLREHQIPCLIKASHDFIYHKLSDLASFGGALPFDAFILAEAKSYLAILYYKIAKPKIIYFIPINTVLFLEMYSHLLTEEMANKFCEFKIKL